jgi:predicted permease
MAIGFACGKFRILGPEAVRGISSLIIKLALPALILTSLQRPFSPELLSVSLQTLLVATCFYAAIIALSLLAVRLLRAPAGQSGVFAFALAFSNCGFIGFPVVTSILGPDALFLVAIHNTLFNILAFSLGIVIVSRSAKPGAAVGHDEAGAAAPRPKIALSHILNNNVIAVVAGFALFVLSIRLPRAIALPIEMLGSLTTPLAMIATGAMLARTRLGSVFSGWRLYAVTLIRLVVWPALTLLALRPFPIDRNLALITVIVAGMPAGSNTGLIAEVYGGDTDTASATVFLTTLVSVITIPLMALLVA